MMEVFPTPGAPKSTSLTRSGMSGLFCGSDTGEHGEQETCLRSKKSRFSSKIDKIVNVTHICIDIHAEVNNFSV